MSNSSKIRIINNTGFTITLDVVVKSTKAWKKGYSPIDVLNNETIQAEEQKTVMVAYEFSGGVANVSILCAMDIELFYDFVASRL